MLTIGILAYILAAVNRCCEAAAAPLFLAASQACASYSATHGSAFKSASRLVAIANSAAGRTTEMRGELGITAMQLLWDGTFAGLGR
jgi:hypothetical protein